MRWSVYKDAQAGLRLCWLQTSEDRFSRVEAHISFHTPSSLSNLVLALDKELKSEEFGHKIWIHVL